MSAKIDPAKKAELLRKSATKAFEDGGKKGTLINDVMRDIKTIAPSLIDNITIDDEVKGKNDGIQQVCLTSTITQYVLQLGANPKNNISPIIQSLTHEIHPDDYRDAMKNVILPKIAKLKG